jgi:hypothetical protein
VAKGEKKFHTHHRDTEPQRESGNKKNQIDFLCVLGVSVVNRFSPILLKFWGITTNDRVKGGWGREPMAES